MQIIIPIESLNRDYQFEGGLDAAVEYIKSIYGYPLLNQVSLDREQELISVTFYDQEIDYEQSQQKLNEAIKVIGEGKPRIALSLFEEAVKLDPFNDLTRRNLGSCLLELEELDLAKQVFESCLYINDKDAYSWIGLGNSFAKRPANNLENIYKGIFYFEKAIEKNPESFLAINNLAATYSRIGNQQKAIELFNQAIELSPKDQRPLLGRAFTYLELNHLSKAKADFQACYELSGSTEQGKMAGQYLNELSKIIK